MGSEPCENCATGLLVPHCANEWCKWYRCSANCGFRIDLPTGRTIVPLDLLDAFEEIGDDP